MIYVSMFLIWIGGFLMGFCYARLPKRAVIKKINVKEGTITVSDASRFQLGDAIEIVEGWF